MVPVPNSGASSQPPSNAPMMPTITLRNMPCCASVLMIMLATQPRMPPTIIQIIKFIFDLQKSQNNQDSAALESRRHRENCEGLGSRLPCYAISNSECSKCESDFSICLSVAPSSSLVPGGAARRVRWIIFRHSSPGRAHYGSEGGGMFCPCDEAAGLSSSTTTDAPSLAIVILFA